MHRAKSQFAGPLRLALVITELEPGGAERCLVEIATRLDRNRFAPVVYSLGPPPPPNKSELVSRLAAADIATHFLNLRSPWQYFAAVGRLTALFHQQRPNIVQTFLFHANVVGARASRLARIPHLVAGVRVADPRRARAWLERRATRAAERIVCVSQSVADFCRARGFDAKQLVVIPNGIDVARWQNAQPADLQALGIRPGRRLIVYVGRLDAQKGLDRFFAELPSIFRESPEHDFLLVGDGPLRSSLVQRARELLIAGRVHFLGWRPDIVSLLALAELLVLPSRWEGMPNVILEAMAAGKPVVATQVAGIAELLGPVAELQTVPCGDWDGFRRKIVEILKNARLAGQISQSNALRAHEFSVNSMVACYQQLYASLAGE
jgi:glycosyltransferase involved in cell wall biosynthesis